MATFRIKNYKGNLLESVQNFQKKYPLRKITEAVEEEDSLKITTESSLNSEFDLNYAWETLMSSNDQFLGLIDQIKRTMRKTKSYDIEASMKEVMKYRSGIGDSNNPYFKKVDEFFRKAIPAAFSNDGKETSMFVEMTIDIIFNMAAMADNR